MLDQCKHFLFNINKKLNLDVCLQCHGPDLHPHEKPVLYPDPCNHALDLKIV